MFERWGRFVHRRRWWVLGASVVLLLASIAVAGVGSTFRNETTIGSEAERGSALLTAELPQGQPSFTVVALSDSLTVTQPAFRAALEQAVAPLRGDANVTGVTLPYRAGGSIDPARVSPDGHDAIVTVATIDGSRQTYEEIRPRLRSATLQLAATGSQVVESEYERAINADASRGETLSIPISLVLLLLVFGGVLAALLPVGVAVLAVLGGLAVVAVLTHHTNVDSAAQNVVIFLGLGLGIDYSLFIVTRFREELRRRGDTGAALAAAMPTAGRATAVSGVTVTIGLLGMLVFQGTFLASFSIAVSGVVLLAIFYALTFLPALLSLLGSNVDRLRIRRVRPPAASSSRWHRLAMAVMAHPVAVLLPCLAVFVVAFIPFTQIRFGTDHLTTLPASFESRQAAEIILSDLPHQAQSQIDVAVHVTDGASPLSAAHVAAVCALSARLAQVHGVVSVGGITPPSAGIPCSAYVRAYSGPVAALRPEAATAVRQTIGRDVADIPVAAASTERSDATRAVVAAIRALPSPPGTELLVTGQTAFDVDFVNYIDGRIPYALGFVLVATVVVLLVLFRSVVLPVKAVVMNLLSISASFGALVFVFQEGHLSGVLDFTPAEIDPALPVILFCVLFGLSMDYEVFLLTRIQEEWAEHGDTRRAIAAGLERSAPLVTGAALIMIAVVTCFGLGQTEIMKIIGLGMALAVAVDATIVRALVVPATMRLMGDLTWWAPRWLRPRAGGGGDGGAVAPAPAPVRERTAVT